MKTIKQIELAWELYKAGVSASGIAEKTSNHQARIYRYIDEFRRSGLRRYLRKHRNAKKGKRQKRETDPLLKKQVFDIRKEYREWFYRL